MPRPSALLEHRARRLSHATGGNLTAAAVEPFDAPFPVPEHPPAEWFLPASWLEPGQGLTITDEGQVAGYFYEWAENGEQVCIVGHPGYPEECASPVPSVTGYMAFHQQSVVVEDGREIRVGAIGNVGGHASPYVTPSVAQRVYADPDCQMIVCRAYDTEHGALIAGALVPGLTYGDVARLRRCGLSGDWRPMDRGWFSRCGVTASAAAAADFYDCLGPTLVNRPGLPLVRAYRRVASAQPVMLGGLAGVDYRDRDDEEAAMPPDTLTAPGVTNIETPDGTLIQVHAPTGSGSAVADGLESPSSAVRTAAPADAVPAEDGSTPADAPADTGDVEQRVADAEARLAALEDVVAQLVDAYNQATGAEMAALDQPVALPPLTAAPPTAPAGDAPDPSMPHDFVAAADGTCAVCGGDKADPLHDVPAGT